MWACAVDGCQYRINRNPAPDLPPDYVSAEDQRVIAEYSARHYIETHGAVDLVGRILDYVIVRSHHSAEAREVMAMIERSGFGYGPADEHVEPVTPAAPSPPRTSMTAAVSADLDRMPLQEGGVDASLRALASYLAEAIDAHGGTGNPGTTARLAQELRTVLTELARRERAGDDEAQGFARSLAEPAKPAPDTSWIRTTEATP